MAQPRLPQCTRHHRAAGFARLRVVGVQLGRPAHPCLYVPRAALAHWPGQLVTLARAAAAHAHAPPGTSVVPEAQIVAAHCAPVEATAQAAPRCPSRVLLQGIIAPLVRHRLRPHCAPSGTTTRAATGILRYATALAGAHRGRTATREVHRTLVFFAPSVAAALVVGRRPLRVRWMDTGARQARVPQT